MKTKLTLVVALGLSMATLTAVAQQAARDSTLRGTPPTQPTYPSPTRPITPPTTTPGGPYGSMGSSINVQSFRNLSDAQALSVIAAIDSNEISAARFVGSRKTGKHHTSTTGSAGTYGGTSSTNKGTGISSSHGSV